MHVSHFGILFQKQIYTLQNKSLDFFANQFLCLGGHQFYSNYKETKKANGFCLLTDLKATNDTPLEIIFEPFVFVMKRKRKLLSVLFFSLAK